MDCAEVEKIVFSCIGPVFQFVIGKWCKLNEVTQERYLADEYFS